MSVGKIAKRLGPVIAVALSVVLEFKYICFAITLVYFILAFLKSFLVINESFKENDDEQKAKITKRKNIIDDFKQGFAATIMNKGIIFLWFNSALTNFFIHPFIDIGLLSFLKMFIVDSPVSSDKLYLIVSAGGTTGTLLSIAIMFALKGNFDRRRGLTIGVIGISGLTSILIGSMVCFTKYGGFSAISLAILIGFIQRLMFISFNFFTVFFVSIYQRIIPKNILGKFVANLLTMYMVCRALGSLMYGTLFSYGLYTVLVVLGIGALLKVLVHIIFIKSGYFINETKQD